MHHSHEGLDRGGGTTRTALWSPLRDRDFRWLWTGMCLSLLGDGAFMVALAWQAFTLTGGPAGMSYIGIAMTVPMIVFLLVGGVAGDRCDRRTILVGADLLRGVAVALVAVLVLGGHVALWHLVVLAAVYGTGAAFHAPAFDAFVPEVVGEELLPQANALDQLVRPLALRLAGPAAGGALVGVAGAGAAFLLDAVSFAAATACVLVLRVPRRSRGAAAAGGVVADLRTGWRFVRGHTWLWATFASAALAYLLFMGPVEVLLPWMVKDALHGSALQLGLVFAAGGLASMLCAVALGSGALPRRSITFMLVAWAVATLAVAGYGAATAVWQLMLASALFNGLETAGTIVWATLKQRHVPGELLGRVSSLDWLISIGLLPVSFALTGPVSATIGARATLVGAGLLGAAVTLAALFTPGMRALEAVPPVAALPEVGPARAAERRAAA
jgi:DHA3 family tetracycline resistance protein-like MFS transporter